MDEPANATTPGRAIDLGGPASTLALADWRRRVADLHADVRARATNDPYAAWRRWARVREELFRTHPCSPVPVAARSRFRARHWPYDPSLRFESVVVELTPTAPDAPDPIARRPGGMAPLRLPSSAGSVPPMRRIGTVTLPLPLATATLALFWVDQYSGGLFLPFADATNGSETYVGGRYLLDGAKSADLGGDPDRGTLVVDLNFSYQPSCAFDPRWSCPLAPPENRLAVAIRAGERLA